MGSWVMRKSKIEAWACVVSCRWRSTQLAMFDGHHHDQGESRGPLLQFVSDRRGSDKSGDARNRSRRMIIIITIMLKRGLLLANNREHRQDQTPRPLTDSAVASNGHARGRETGSF